jgi:hypothetical protein
MEAELLILDPARNRQYGNVTAFLNKLGTPEVLEFVTSEKGLIRGVLVEVSSAAITASHLSSEAKGRLPELGQTQLGEERTVIGFVIQKTSDSSHLFLRGVLNPTTGEGLLEACDSPVKDSTGGMALPVTDGEAAGVTVPYP